MNRLISLFSVPLLGLALAGCGNQNSENRASSSRRSPSFVSSPSSSPRSASSLLAEVRLKRDILSHSARGRTGRPMTPRYITIHSTQNWSPGADSNRHALALKNSKLGRISWHYTTDDRQAVQHLPTTCLLYTSPSPRDQRGSRMPSSA